MKKTGDDLPELLRRLGRCQRQINTELAKGAKADQAKIAAAFAAGKDFARGAAPYCHPPRYFTVNGPRLKRRVVAAPVRPHAGPVLPKPGLENSHRRPDGAAARAYLGSNLTHPPPSPAACAHADQSGDTSLRSKLLDRARPENRLRCASAGNLAMPLQTPRERPQSWRWCHSDARPAPRSLRCPIARRSPQRGRRHSGRARSPAGR